MEHDPLKLVRSERWPRWTKWLPNASRAAIRMILERPLNLEWSVQGFGMLRCYLDKDKRYRLNLWDSAFAVPNVSVIHDHPWSFDSWVVNGTFTNIRYDIDSAPLCHSPGWGDALFDWQVIRTGPGGGPEGGERGQRLHLRARAPEHYITGDTYHQEPTEIHESRYSDGTVTLNDRIRLPDGDHARVFWPTGSEWVDAEPREATCVEVAMATRRALERWE